MNINATLFGLFFVFVCGQTASAQSSDTEKEITELSKKKWQWMADKNADSLAGLFHDKAKFVHMGGTWGKDRKAALLATLPGDRPVIG